MMKCFLLIFVPILVATVVDATNCGVPSKSVGLIVNGKDFNRGKWPWMAALMLRFENGNKFFCGGVLVSKTKVLTAAHCIHEKQKTRVNARNILILLGAYDLSNLNQNGVFSVAPSEIIIHPDWNPYVERYDADIAVINLEDEVPSTQFIRPICIASNDLEYREGHVAGWGKSKVDAKGHEIFPKELKIPIWTNEYCFLESIEFVTLASRRTLCAGNRDGASVCHGDSGGGLFVESNGVFFLQGLVSASLLSQGLCDVSNFALYTNVNKFKDWIDVPTEQATVGVADLQHETCGVMSASAGLVRNGIKSTNTQWPWAVFVFNKAFQNTIGNDTYSSFEVGTLISKRHVLTSGYFVTQDDKENGGRKPIPTNLIKTYFGVINIDEFAGPQTVVLDDAEKIMIHPELSNIESLKFANFAIIKLKIDVTFSEFISPICLSSFTGDPYSLSGKHPYGVGMGYSELTKTKDRKHSPMRIRTAEVCESVFGYSLKAADTKNKKSSYFCAGGDGKSSSCWSDNPLYMKFGNKWFLHAFHTISFTNAGGCLTDKPALYEIAGQYYNWIMNMIKD